MCCIHEITYVNKLGDDALDFSQELSQPALAPTACAKEALPQQGEL